MQILEVDVEVAEALQQRGDAGFLVLCIEREHQRMPVIGQFEGIGGQPRRNLPQSILQLQRQLFLAEFAHQQGLDRKSTRLNSSHLVISYAVFCLKKKNSNKI